MTARTHVLTRVPSDESEASARSQTRLTRLGPVTSHSDSTLLRPLGTWMVIRGGLAVVFGLATVFWPREQIGSPANLNIRVDIADVLLLAYLLLQGILVLVQGLRTRTDMRMPMLGQAVVAIPGVLFLLVADTPGQLRAAIAVWAVLHGILELWIWRGHRDEGMSSDFLIIGGIHVLLGVILFAGTDMNALSVLGFTGAAALIAGVFSIVGGTARRSDRARTRAADAEVADTQDAEAAETLSSGSPDARDGKASGTPDSASAPADGTGGDEP